MLEAVLVSIKKMSQSSEVHVLARHHRLLRSLQAHCRWHRFQVPARCMTAIVGASQCRLHL